MEKNQAVSTLSALAHGTRIDIIRLLIRAGCNGLPAGQIADALNVRANTLSNNLSILAAAGLVRSEREGRSIRYHARFEAMQHLLGYLMEDCCGGRPDLCRPVLRDIARSNDASKFTQ